VVARLNTEVWGELDRGRQRSDAGGYAAGSAERTGRYHRNLADQTTSAQIRLASNFEIIGRERRFSADTACIIVNAIRASQRSAFRNAAPMNTTTISQAIPRATEHLTTSYLEMLKFNSGYAKLALSPPWSGTTDRLRNLLLTVAVIFAVSLTGVRPAGGDSLIGQLLLTPHLHLLGIGLLIYALFAYTLSASNDIKLHKLLLNEQDMLCRESLSALSTFIEERKIVTSDARNNRRTAMEELRSEWDEGSKRYKTLFDQCEVGDEEEYQRLTDLRRQEAEQHGEELNRFSKEGNLDLEFVLRLNSYLTVIQKVEGDVLVRSQLNRRWQYYFEYFGAILVSVAILAWALV
jgi:hypothetical protein